MRAGWLDERRRMSWVPTCTWTSARDSERCWSGKFEAMRKRAGWRELGYGTKQRGVWLGGSFERSKGVLSFMLRLGVDRRPSDVGDIWEACRRATIRREVQVLNASGNCLARREGCFCG